MKVLVTGGAGYIGSIVSAHLLEGGHDVTVLDDLSTGHLDAVPQGARLVMGSLFDAELLRSVLFGKDAVLHFAARSLVAESVEHPERYWRANLGGTLELLGAQRTAEVPRLVFSSTAAVYGEAGEVPIREDAPPRPTSPYGASKLAVDHLLAGWSHAHGLAAISLRYFNVAGAHGRLRERHNPETHLIPIVLDVALGRRDQVMVYGTDYPTRDGTAVRDYLHVDDLAVAHLLALDALKSGWHTVFNLGNGRGYSVREVVETARQVTGRPITAVDAPRRAGDPAVLVASSERIREELGWEPHKPDLTRIVQDAWSVLS